MGEINHTSQWSRIAERPPARDLRGGKASEDSFTRWAASLVAAYEVEIQFDLFSFIALGLTVDVEGSKCSVRPGPVTDCVGSETTSSALRGRAVRWITLCVAVYIPLDS